MTAIRILMGTYNGSRYLPSQLESIANQTHRDWVLWCSDDGSTDDSRDILAEFARQHPTLILDGPGLGPAHNFMNMLCHPELPEGYVALSDQDDVWLPHKLSRAQQMLSDQTGPALYCSRTILTDDALTWMGPSRHFKDGGFPNALVQNVAPGNTILLNPAALALVRAAGIPRNIPYHDWWLYQLIAGAGGKVVIDAKPGLYYRQHDMNEIGANRGLNAVVNRLRKVQKREFGQWIRANLAALRQCRDLLTTDAQVIVEDLLQSNDWARAFKRHGIRRQGRVGQAMLRNALRMGWI